MDRSYLVAGRKLKIVKCANGLYGIKDSATFLAWDIPTRCEAIAMLTLVAACGTRATSSVGWGTEMPAETCMVCGTVSPHGGLMTAYRDGAEVGVMCAYRLGCTPGVARTDNG